MHSGDEFMDDIHNKSLLLSKFKGSVLIIFMMAALSGCLPCGPYPSCPRCYHWIPAHYKGSCFVPSHCDGFVGTGAFGTRPMTDNYQLPCENWQSSNDCGNYWQSGCCFKQQPCCSFRDHGWRWPHEWWQSILCAYMIH